MREYLPRGNTLSDEVFRRRHLLLCWVLALHVPTLFVFGLWRGYGLGHSALEVTVPAACLLFARLARHRRLASFFSTAGLVFCSYVLVHLSGGTIEAHFHFFVLIGLIALYQDWVPFGWNVAFTVLSHGIGNTIDANMMFNHGAAQNQPWGWALIHGVAVLAACVGVVIFWKNTEQEQQRSNTLATELTEAELAAVKAEADRRQSVSELFVNLARRNQSLLDRQLGLIAELEQREQSPDSLSELFQLDHLATRIRRNAESLLVLSGDEPPRRWGRPVPLGEVVRAAAAEVEDYQRVEVLVNTHLEVEGRAVADMAHLLAELIENATSFSPPANEVRVRSHPTFDQGASFVLSIEDTGIGMTASALQAANEILAEPPDIDVRRSTLGLHVVGRLAKRYGLRVRLGPTPGGGVTALVTLPDNLVSERRRSGAAGAAASTPVGVGAGVGTESAGNGHGNGNGNGNARRATLVTEPAVHAVPDVPEVEPLVPLPEPPALPEPTRLSTLEPPPRPALEPPPPPALEAPASSAPAPTAPAPSPAPTARVPAPPASTAQGSASSAPTAPAPSAAPTARVPAPPASTAQGSASSAPTAPARARPASEPPAGRGTDGRDLTPPRLWADGWHLTTPGTGSASTPVEARHEPTAPPPPAPAPAPAPPRTADGLVRRVPGAGLGRPQVEEPASRPSPPPAPAPDPVPPRTADGLVRRVPGAGLAAGLRRPARSSPGRGAAAARVPQPRDRERMRSMLSRFQASQRAGRSAVEAPPGNGHQQEDA